MAPKGFSFGINADKTQMLALGDAIKARLEMERDFETVDDLCPPPPAVRLEGARLPGMAAGWVGLYERQQKREIEGGAPCYRNVCNPVLWLGRDDEGSWRGQVESKLGERASLLKLVDKACTSPSSKTDAAWQYIDPDTKDWETCWQLNCTAATLEECAEARAALPPAPHALVFEGPALPGALAAGFLGVYVRGTEYSQTERREVTREVLHSPCWRQIQNPSLWICRGPDGGWVAQGENALGTQNGFLRLRDTQCTFPCDACTPDTLLVNDGNSWVSAPAEVRCRAADDGDIDAAKAELPTPARFVRIVGGQHSDTASMDPKEAGEDYSGVYELESGHVNHGAAWMRVVGPDGQDTSSRTDDSLWLVRGRSGCWVGQRDTQLSRDRGGLQLPATACSLPYDHPGQKPLPRGLVWQQWAAGQWRGMPGMRVTPIADEEFDEVAPIVGHAHAPQHEHGHAGEEHAHGHGGHAHEGGCCGHEHADAHHAHHEHGHVDEHAHAHAHGDDCCGHDH